MATSDVVNALNGGVGRLSRRPFWVGAVAFVLFTAVGVVALMSVAIGVLATLRVAYTTSIDRVSNVTPSTDQRLADRPSRPQTMTSISPVVLSREVSARPQGATDLPDATLPRNDLPSLEMAQPAAGVTLSSPDAATTSARPVEEAAKPTITELIEAQLPPTPPAAAPSDGTHEGHPIEPAASSSMPPASGVAAPSVSASEAAPATPSVGSLPSADIASTAGAPETDEIAALATAPLPLAVTAAALSHLRHALKRRAQARAIKHTAHKPAQPPSRTAFQNNNYRPFDPFQPATPSTAATSTRQHSW